MFTQVTVKWHKTEKNCQFEILLRKQTNKKYFIALPKNRILKGKTFELYLQLFKVHLGVS